MSEISEKKVKKLRIAMGHSLKKLEPFRKNFFEVVKQYVGNHYSTEGAEDRVPMNMIELAASIYLRQLAARQPRAFITTKYEELKPKALDLALACDHLFDEIRLGETLRRIALNALFSVGIVKKGLNHSGTVEIGGFRHDVGQPFADSVDLDNFVYDTTAQKWEDSAYFGDRYRLPLQSIKDAGIFDKEAIKNLKATQKSAYDQDGNKKLSTISVGEGGEATDEDELEEMVELWDIYLTRENRFITITADGADTPLRDVEWDGPEGGPYDILSFADVPGSIMPLAPAAGWRDMHDIINSVMRKISRQAERQKTILGVEGGAEADGQRIVSANDGDAIRLDKPDAAKEFRLGGFDPQTLGFATHMRDVFNQMGGNLDSLGGLSSSADTAKQESLISESSSKRIAEMQDAIERFTSRVVRDMAWYLHHDPLIELPLVKRVSGIDMDIPVAYTPEDREGDYLDYNFSIEPYSMAHDTPGQKIQTITSTMAQVFMPLAQQMEQQGVSINFEKLAKTIAQYTNTPEIEDILIFSNSGSSPESPVDTSSAYQSTKSPISHRTYERVNRQGNSRHGSDVALTQMMFSKDGADGVQPDTLARMT